MENEIWKMFMLLSSKDEYVNEDKRYNLLLLRLLSILRSKVFDSFDCIYFSDYQQSITNKSKWNLNVPVICKNKYKNLISEIFILQFQLRNNTGNFSFSDFMFRDINKKMIIQFRREDSISSIEFELKNHDYINELIIRFPIKVFVQQNHHSNKINWINYINGWYSANLLEFNFLLDYNLDNIKKDFDNIVEGSYVLKMLRLYIGIDYNTSKINDDTLKYVLWVMYSSLAFSQIKAFNYIPSIPIKDGLKEESSGGIVIPEFTDEKKLSDSNREQLFILCQKWFSENAIADYSEVAKQEVMTHARKAAISQVMLRNMSHNIGSHVLSRMIHPDQIKEIFKKHELIRYILSKDVLT